MMAGLVATAGAESFREKMRRIKAAGLAAQQEQKKQEELAKQQQSLERDQAIAESQKAYRGHTDEMYRIGESAPNDFDTQMAAGGSFLEQG